MNCGGRAPRAGGFLEASFHSRGETVLFSVNTAAPQRQQIAERTTVYHMTSPLRNAAMHVS
jgi:hypothetical protein